MSSELSGALSAFRSEIDELKQNHMNNAESLSQSSLQSQQSIASDMMTAFRAEMLTALHNQRTEMTAAFETQLQGMTSPAVCLYHVPRDYATVQEAINAAEPGQRVVIAAGLHKGKIAIDKNVELVGQTRGEVFLEWNGIGNVISVNDAASATLSNLNINQSCEAKYREAYMALDVSGDSNVLCEACDFCSASGHGE